MPFDAKLNRLASTAPVITGSNLDPVLLCCCRREHRVDRSYHLLHTLWQLLHVLVCGRVCARVAQVSLDAATAYKVDSDAIAAKVKQEFTAKEKAKKAAQPAPKATKKAA